MKNMKKIKTLSIQDWIPFEEILDNGIIKLKNNEYIKILKISPINFNLKSQLEKETILNSYKLFLKTCNFDIQILIQSNKEDLSQNISQIENNSRKESQKIKKIAQEYINYIKEQNKSKKSSNKNFYIIIKNQRKIELENLIIEELNEDYFKIKECLSRCGNIVKDIDDKKEIQEILYSFFNNRLYQERI